MVDMRKWVFSVKVIMILAVFFILGLLYIVNPLSAAHSFFKNPFKDTVSIDIKHSVYDSDRGRLKLVIDKEKGVNSDYVGFTFKEGDVTKDYYLETQLIRDTTIFYFDVKNCIHTFDTVHVSINEDADNRYFTKDVAIKRGGIVGDNVYHNLCSFCERKGDGSVDSPISVCTCEDLQHIQHNLSMHYEIGSTIDCGDYIVNNTFTTIGDNFDPFTGTIDGKGNTIYNVKINEPDKSYVGLFGVLFNGRIENLGLRNASITGGVFTGGIVGRQEKGELSKVFIENSNVKGSANVGGIVGFSNGEIVDSFSTAEVSSLIFGGGIVGGCECELKNSYFASKLDAPYNGLVGNNLPNSKISNSYYDIDLVEFVSVAAGESKSTEDFSHENEFASWDFGDTWEIRSEHAYPTLVF